MRPFLRVGATVTQGDSGWGAKAHVPALHLLLDYTLQAVCTAHEDTAQASKAKFDAVHAFHDVDAMAQHPEIDLVVVCVTLMIAGGHAIDGLCYVLGEFDALAARRATRIKAWKSTETGQDVPVDSPDTISVAGVLKSSAEGSGHVAAIPFHPNGTRLRFGDGIRGRLRSHGDALHADRRDRALGG